MPSSVLSFAQHIFIYVVIISIVYFYFYFLLQTCTPLYVYTAICLFTCDQTFWFFLGFENCENKAAYGHSGTALCGHILSFLLDKYLRLEFWGHMIGLCLTFYKTLKLFSQVGVPFYVPTNSIEFQLFCTFLITWYCLLNLVFLVYVVSLVLSVFS